MVEEINGSGDVNEAEELMLSRVGNGLLERKTNSMGWPWGETLASLVEIRAEMADWLKGKK